ncbi:hypothetical protein Y981_12340 [Leptospirillum ferriphilum YSK]|uniref:Uncharacterized protein n=4 Tax=Leptospirillum ferriphilum TaxID=178606 RepID=A0A059XY13_9BACT|nr:hypothetical protein [Leptospirillum ferriphilum]AFS54564.1 hypothetical protein LFML04_2374 [Leptospirillum ferriphilum ML-04]AIA32025.1 hypothetical protein Y981_12340 [Leptospirillum ferriphilum YSK]
MSTGGQMIENNPNGGFPLETSDKNLYTIQTDGHKTLFSIFYKENGNTLIGWNCLVDPDDRKGIRF